MAGKVMDKEKKEALSLLVKKTDSILEYSLILGGYFVAMLTIFAEIFLGPFSWSKGVAAVGIAWSLIWLLLLSQPRVRLVALCALENLVFLCMAVAAVPFVALLFGVTTVPRFFAWAGRRVLLWHTARLYGQK